jgi:hypothetical protein
MSRGPSDPGGSGKRHDADSGSEGGALVSFTDTEGFDLDLEGKYTPVYPSVMRQTTPFNVCLRLESEAWLLSAFNS